jgi:hypothetical protein
MVVKIFDFDRKKVTIVEIFPLKMSGNTPFFIVFAQFKQCHIGVEMPPKERAHATASGNKSI